MKIVCMIAAMLVSLLATGALADQASDKAYVKSLQANFGGSIKFASTEAERVVRSFNIDCNDPYGRYLPMMNLLYVILRESNAMGAGVLPKASIFVDSRGRSVRVYQVRGNSAPSNVLFEITEWNEVSLRSINREAVMASCAGMYGPIWASTQRRSSKDAGSEVAQKQEQSKTTAAIPDAVFLNASSKTFDALLDRGAIGIKQDVKSCYSKVSFDSTASAVASCFSSDLTGSWIDEGAVKNLGAAPDEYLQEPESFNRAENALRVIGFASEDEIADILKLWKAKISTAFRKAGSKGLIRLGSMPPPPSPAHPPPAAPPRRDRTPS